MSGSRLIPGRIRGFPVRRFFALALLLLLFAGLAVPLGWAEEKKPRHGMVVAVSPPGADVGRDILKQGGNAVDAAVATAFALAVTYPAAGNIGGGGFMLVYPGGKAEPVVIDYRETAPAAATQDDVHARTTAGTATRPSACPAPSAAWPWPTQQFGKLPWKDVVLPAVKLAEDGFVIDDALAGSLNGVVGGSQRVPRAAARLRQGRRQGRLAGRRPPGAEGPGADAAADRRATGRTPSTRAPIADLLVAEMKAGGGLITKDDLAGYKAKARKPIHGTYRGYDVYGPPPPSSGGICLVEMLNILENFDLQEAGPLVAGDAAPDDRGDAPRLLRPGPLPRRPGLRQDPRPPDDARSTPRSWPQASTRSKATPQRGPGQGHPADGARATARRTSRSSTTTAWR